MTQSADRVVITGMGIVSCLGNDLNSVSSALKEGRSGITFQSEFEACGMRSHIGSKPDIDIEGAIDRKTRRFMGDGAAYAHIAMEQAMLDAGLQRDEISSPDIGLIAGSGGASSHHQVAAIDALREKGVNRIGPYMVTRTMASSVSACLASAFKIQGLNYSIASACATSAHCIGHAAEQIQLGKQKMIFAGGGEEIHWTLASLFDAMGALSTRYNDKPTAASRPFDAARDGFVIAGGGGIVVLESLEHAVARDAKIYGEVVGYAATSDGADMVSPSGEGAVRCMQEAISGCDIPIDYINAHGTSTPVGDITELAAIKQVFTNHSPFISSTKSLSGHPLGAAGVHELIFSALMMVNGFVTGSANIENLVPEADGLNLPLATQGDQQINSFLSNSFGFGGTNACLVVKRLQ